MCEMESVVVPIMWIVSPEDAFSMHFTCSKHAFDVCFCEPMHFRLLCVVGMSVLEDLNGNMALTWLHSVDMCPM